MPFLVQNKSVKVKAFLNIEKEEEKARKETTANKKTKMKLRKLKK